jgi:rRNA maturation RNase YbeY
MAISKGLIRFHVIEAFSLPGKRELKAAIGSLMEEEGKSFTSLDYIFCSDEYLLEINQKYLQHDDLTDIITFNLSENKEETIGEIYISVERVRDNAHLFGAPFQEELRRVIFHGALHLCGYGDKTKKETAVMRTKEDYYLRRLT